MAARGGWNRFERRQRERQSRSANAFEKCGGSDVQPVGQLDDIKQADVPFAPLYPTHIVAVQVGQLRQLFL